MNKSMILFLLIITTACGKNHNTDHDGVWMSTQLIGNTIVKIKNDTAYISNHRGLAMIKLNITGYYITFKDSIGEWFGEFGFNDLEGIRTLHHSHFKMNLKDNDTITDENIRIKGGHNFLRINTDTLKTPETIILKNKIKDHRELITKVSNNGKIFFYIINSHGNIEYHGINEIKYEYIDLFNIRVNNAFKIPFKRNKENHMSHGNHKEWIIIKNDSVRHYTDISIQNYYELDAISILTYDIYKKTQLKKESLKMEIENFDCEYFKDTAYRK